MEGLEDIGIQRVYNRFRSLTVCHVYTDDYKTGYIRIAGNIRMVRYIGPDMKYYREIVKPIEQRDMELTSEWEMM